jgi:hypothetical protein
MTEENARAAADAVLIVAGVAAAYVVLTSPPLRRLTRLGLRYWLGASVPVYVFAQLRRAWVESAPRA